MQQDEIGGADGIRRQSGDDDDLLAGAHGRIEQHGRFDVSQHGLHRVGLGLVLIVAFSAGLAGVLTAIGFALVFARRLSSRLPMLARIGARTTRAGGVTGVAVRAFPSMSAAVVVAAGAVILLRALAQQGLV